MSWGKRKDGQAYPKRTSSKLKTVGSIKATTFAKRKTIRNTGKRPRLGSHGFKVYKNTKVYIGKETEGGWSRDGKPAPRDEVVQTVRNMWNTDPSIIAMRKFIKSIKITYRKSGNLAGQWSNSEKKFSVIDNGTANPHDYEEVVIHEVIGHAFWDFSRKWRRIELANFNKLANSLPPVNDYVKDNENTWKTWNDEHSEIEKKFEKSIEHIPDYDAPEDLANEYQEKQEQFNNQKTDDDYKSMTRYANEQHSAVSELMYGQSYHNTLIDQQSLQKLKEAWLELHY